MVRLKVCFSRYVSSRYGNFNSTMVRLKVSLSSANSSAILFQFHYGTIKSGIKDKLRFASIKFQFHYGTIKRSTSARLSNNILYFNSTMVRLKDTNRFNAMRTAFSFQFHYGTIKRLTLEKISVLIFKNLANTKL